VGLRSTPPHGAEQVGRRVGPMAHRSAELGASACVVRSSPLPSSCAASPRLTARSVSPVSLPQAVQNAQAAQMHGAAAAQAAQVAQMHVAAAAQAAQMAQLHGAAAAARSVVAQGGQTGHAQPHISLRVTHPQVKPQAQLSGQAQRQPQAQQKTQLNAKAQLRVQRQPQAQSTVSAATVPQPQSLQQAAAASTAALTASVGSSCCSSSHGHTAQQHAHGAVVATPTATCTSRSNQSHHQPQEAAATAAGATGSMASSCSGFVASHVQVQHQEPPRQQVEEHLRQQSQPHAQELQPWGQHEPQKPAEEEIYTAQDTVTTQDSFTMASITLPLPEQTSCAETSKMDNTSTDMSTKMSKCRERDCAEAELLTAVEGHDIAALRAALPGAVMAGVSVEVVDQAHNRYIGWKEDALRARMRNSAAQALRDALCGDAPECLVVTAEWARQAEVHGDLLDSARREIERRRACQDAEEALYAALNTPADSKDAPRLGHAISGAERAGVSVGLLSHARGRLAQLEEFEHRQRAISQAEQTLLGVLDSRSDDVTAVTTALEAAIDVGVCREAIERGWKKKSALESHAWQTHKRELAGKKLSGAMHGESPVVLQAAIAYASEFGVHEDSLGRARQRMEEMDGSTIESDLALSSDDEDDMCLSPNSLASAEIFAALSMPSLPAASPKSALQLRRQHSVPEVPPSYGLDVELKAKAQAKYDPGIVYEAAKWIQDITGAPVVGDFFGQLRTGEVLCQLLNAIRPNMVKKINVAGRPFKERENINQFLKTCRALGVQEYALFCTDDLYEEKNLFSVARCIHALGGALQRSVPEFQGPHLGVADTSNAKRDQRRDLGPATQTGGLQVAMERSHIDITSNQIVRGGGALQRSVPEFQGPHQGVADTSNAKRDQKRDLGHTAQTGGLEVAMERSHKDVTSNQIARGGGASQRSVPAIQGPHQGVADTSNAKRDRKRELGPTAQTGGLEVAMERSHEDVTSNQIARGGC